MKKILLVVFALSLSVFSQMQAQNIVITNVSNIDTSYLFQSAIFNFTLQNNGANPDTVFVEVKAYDTTNHAMLPVDFLSSVQIPFAAGQAYTFGSNQNLVPVAFQTGDNVVVIWPIINGIPGDSIYTNIFLWEANGINDPSLQNRIFLSKTSVQNQFMILNQSNFSILDSKVFDLNGKIVSSFGKEERTINLQNLSQGIYLLEVNLSKGKKSVFKIVVD